VLAFSFASKHSKCSSCRMSMACTTGCSYSYLCCFPGFEPYSFRAAVLAVPGRDISALKTLSAELEGLASLDNGARVLMCKALSAKLARKHDCLL